MVVINWTCKRVNAKQVFIVIEIKLEMNDNIKRHTKHDQGRGRSACGWRYWHAPGARLCAWISKSTRQQKRSWVWTLWNNGTVYKTWANTGETREDIASRPPSLTGKPAAYQRFCSHHRLYSAVGDISLDSGQPVYLTPFFRFFTFYNLHNLLFLGIIVFYIHA